MRFRMASRRAVVSTPCAEAVRAGTSTASKPRTVSIQRTRCIERTDRLRSLASLKMLGIPRQHKRCARRARPGGRQRAVRDAGCSTFARNGRGHLWYRCRAPSFWCDVDVRTTSRRSRGAPLMRAARIASGTTLALSLCWPALARGASDYARGAPDYPPCTREPSDTDVTAAKAAFQAGNVAFGEADYPRAILYWRDAYRRDCTAHALLLNLARAEELNGNKRAAVAALETYLARVPTSPERAQIERRIAVDRKSGGEGSSGGARGAGCRA